MSLAAHQMPSGAVASGLAYNPSMGTAHPNMSTPSASHSEEGLRLPGAAGPSSDSSSSRGELSGDKCISVDLFAPVGVQSACWSEQNSECHYFVNERFLPLVELSSKGKSIVEESRTISNELLLSAVDDISVSTTSQHLTASSRNSQTEKTLPLQLFQSLSRDPSDAYFAQGLMASLLQYAMRAPLGSRDLAGGGNDGAAGAKKKKKAKRTKCRKVTLISPCSYDQLQTRCLLEAADRADLLVQNIFNRGVATVAGTLYRGCSAEEGSSGSKTPQKNLHHALQASVKVDPTKDPLLLYLNVYGCGEDLQVGAQPPQCCFDAALIRCEGGAQANQLGNLLSFERLCTLAALGGALPTFPEERAAGPWTEAELAGQLAEAVESLFRIAAGHGIGQADVDCVLLDGLLLPSIHKKLQQLGRAAAGAAVTPWTDTDAAVRAVLGRAMTVVRAHDRDAVVGASLLTAAELDSSKQYLNLEDGWKIAYLLPIADGVLLGCDVGLQVLWDEAAEAAAAAAAEQGDRQGEGGPKVEVLFKRGLRAWKEDLGPIRPQYGMNPAELVVRREFKWGSRANPSGKAPSLGWPKLRLLQRTEHKWDVIGNVSPLVAKKGGQTEAGAKAEAAQSCTVSVRVEPSSSLVVVTEEQGESVSERRSTLWLRAQVALVLLLPFLLIGAYYIYSYLVRRFTAAEHEAWLADFYRHNAPEKLEADPQLIARTLKKYHGRMFLLWRNLEKAYDVKWQPPDSIVDPAD